MVIFSTGSVYGGSDTTEGIYVQSDTDPWGYGSWLSRTPIWRLANYGYNAVSELKQNADVYSIGLFQVFEEVPEEGDLIINFFRRFATDLASSADKFYPVNDPNDLEFTFGDVADVITDNVSGTFLYPGADNKDYGAIYYYQDSYFDNSAYTYNEHLATMSLCLELSAWGSNETSDYTQKSRNAEKLLTDIGFSDFQTNQGFKEKPTQDSIGVVAANKKIQSNGKDYTLVAVAIRGGGYESEWASNFTLGYGAGYSDPNKGIHEGFYEARNQVTDFVDNYVRNNVEGNLKLWIVGYSRAGATANIAGAYYDDNYSSFSDDNISLVPEDIYTYTFEAPRGTVYDHAKDFLWLNKPLYNNIFNIINPADPVTKVAMSAWSFVRFGVDNSLPTKETDGNYNSKKSAMLTQLNNLENKVTYLIDDFAMKKIKINGWNLLPGGTPLFETVDDQENKKSQSAYLDDYITRLVTEENLIRDRNTYKTYFEDNIREICKMFFGTDSSKTEKMISCATEKFKNNWGWVVFELLKPFGGEDAAYNKVAEYLKESLNEANISYNEDDFDAAITTICDLLVAVAVNHPNLGLTLGLNMESIGSIHSPEICLAWLMSADGYYTGTESTEDFYAYPAYRIIHINCPVDVEVYNENGILVAQFITDVPQEFSDSSIVAALSEQEKLIYLPADMNFTIKLTATDDGEMSYAVDEYSYDSGKIARFVNYYAIPLSAGKVFNANVPAISEENIGDGSAVKYTLSDANGLIQENDDIRGNDIINSYFNIISTTEEASKGITFGGGLYLKGNAALLTAVPNEGYLFDGWYENNKKVSSNLEYKIIVQSEKNFVAKFVQYDSIPTVSSGDGDPTVSSGDGDPEVSVSTTDNPSTSPVDNTTSSTPAVTSSVTNQDTLANNKNNKILSPNTGDKSNLIFFSFIMCISMFCLLAIIRIGNRHKT